MALRLGAARSGAPNSRQIYRLGPDGEVLTSTSPQRRIQRRTTLTRQSSITSLPTPLAKLVPVRPRAITSDFVHSSQFQPQPAGAAADGGTTKSDSSIDCLQKKRRAWLAYLADSAAPHVTAAGTTYRGRALICLAPTHPVRRVCIWLIEWVWLDRFVLFVILLNCGFLALQQPWMAPMAWWAPCELAFQCVFSAEFCIKVVALGFVLHEGAYMRDVWNWLDFIVVVIG
jgi:hypothetical protein